MHIGAMVHILCLFIRIPIAATTPANMRMAGSVWRSGWNI
jgi:hypothetical protein